MSEAPPATSATVPGSLRWLWASVAVVALDQITKWVAMNELVAHQPLAVFPGFNLTLTFNPGAAFSMLDSGGWQRWLLSALAIGVSVFIIDVLRTLPRDRTWSGLGFSLVLGGAVGNLVDRLYLSVVVDFFDVYYRTWHWPAFNVADSAICVGAVILIGTAFTKGRD